MEAIQLKKTELFFKFQTSFQVLNDSTQFSFIHINIIYLITQRDIHKTAIVIADVII